MGVGGATLDSSAASATNVMSFTNAGSIAFSDIGAHTLTLTGSNTGLNLRVSPTTGALVGLDTTLAYDLTDANFGHVAAWEYRGDDTAPERHKEQLAWESVKPQTSIPGSRLK